MQFDLVRAHYLATKCAIATEPLCGRGHALALATSDCQQGKLGGHEKLLFCWRDKVIEQPMPVFGVIGVRCGP
jgi:hypothetical protein